MDKAAALMFLAKHAPLPDDSELTDAQLETYDEVRKYFETYPDPACIAPLLQSFGRWSGRGVYQLVPGLFSAYSPEQLCDPLLEALGSPHDSIRYWACQVAQEHPMREAIPHLVICLKDAHSDTRLAAAGALEFAGDPSVIPDIRAALTLASDANEREEFAEIIERLESGA